MRHVVVLIAVLGVGGCYGSSGNERDADEDRVDVAEDVVEHADGDGMDDAGEGPDDVAEAVDDGPDGAGDVADVVDDGSDGAGDATDVDASDARLCRAGTGYCRTDYDPGCPPTIPVDGSPCDGSFYCDYCDSFYPPYWTTASCRGGRWEVGRTVCDPAP